MLFAPALNLNSFFEFFMVLGMSMLYHVSNFFFFLQKLELIVYSQTLFSVDRSKPKFESHTVGKIKITLFKKQQKYRCLLLISG